MKLVYTEEDAIYAFEVLRDLISMAHNEPERVTLILTDLLAQDTTTEHGFLPRGWTPSVPKHKAFRTFEKKEPRWQPIETVPKTGEEVLLAIPAYALYPEMVIVDQWLEIHPSTREEGWFNIASHSATHWAKIVYPKEGLGR